MLRYALIAYKARHSSFPLAALTFVAQLRTAVAQPTVAVVSAHLEVDADPRCTSQADVIARVRARSPRMHFVAERGRSALTIRVHAGVAAGGGVAAAVTLAAAGTQPATRNVQARSCTEAADAVALIIAVTLDPASVDTRGEASTADGRSVPKASASPARREGEDTSRAGPATTSPPRTSVELRPLGSTRKGDTLSVDDSGADSPNRLSFGGQIAAESFIGAAPGLMPGVAFFAIARLERPSVWSPALVLGAHHAWRSGLEERGGTASFTLDAATLDVCPLRLRLGVIEAGPCASTLLGRFTAEATDTVNPAAPSARLFGVVGGAMLVSWRLVGVLEASGRLAVGANLVRDSFEFNPATFHTVPAVSAAANLGIGVRWR